MVSERYQVEVADASYYKRVISCQNGGPAPRPMDLFPISIEGGEIIVDTGTIIQRSGFDESQVIRV